MEMPNSKNGSETAELVRSLFALTVFRVDVLVVIVSGGLIGLLRIFIS
jgi:hypothetical protein